MRPALMVLVDHSAEGTPGIDDSSGAEVLAATLARARQVPRVGRVLLFHPPDAEGRLASRALGFRLWPQSGASVGERYANAFTQAVELGYDGAVVIRAEPELPVAVMTQAVTMLEEHHGAAFPDADGGIALLALQEPLPTIVRGNGPPDYDELVTRFRQQRLRLAELSLDESIAGNGLAS